MLRVVPFMFSLLLKSKIIYCNDELGNLVRLFSHSWPNRTCIWDGWYNTISRPCPEMCVCSPSLSRHPGPECGDRPSGVVPLNTRTYVYINFKSLTSAGFSVKSHKGEFLLVSWSWSAFLLKDRMTEGNKLSHFWLREASSPVISAGTVFTLVDSHFLPLRSSSSLPG